MKKFIAFMLFLVISIGISSCGDENKSLSTTNSYDNYSLNLKVKTMRNNYLDFADIDKIILDVNSTNLEYVVEQDFINDNGNWSIDLIQLPMDKDLTFKARAFIGGSWIYSDERIIQLVDGENNITMILQETAVYAPNQVKVQSMKSYVTTVDDVNYTTVSFKIYSEDDLTYVITDDEGNGTLFDPDSGTITVDGNGDGVLDLNYTRPEVAGTYRNRLKMTNINGDIFIYVFDLIVNDNDEVYVTLNAPPEIDGFEGSQEDNNYTVEVNATDPDGDSSNLTYSWDLTINNDTGDTLKLDSNSATTNTAIVTGFDSKEGDVDQFVLTVEVTDANGSTSTASYEVE